MSNIPKGFQLQIDTWENDLDCRKTQTFSGLTVADVRFFMSIVTQFKSRNTGLHCERRPATHYGNGRMTGDELIEMFEAALQLNPGVSEEIRKTVEDCIDDSEDDDIRSDRCHDYLTDMLGYTEDYQDELNFCRVFDKARVYYFAEEVKDLTEQFLVK